MPTEPTAVAMVVARGRKDGESVMSPLVGRFAFVSCGDVISQFLAFDRQSNRPFKLSVV